MREQVRRLIDEAYVGGNPAGLTDERDPALRLAGETIRLARLAASTHMILAARQIAAAEAEAHARRREPVAAPGGAS